MLMFLYFPILILLWTPTDNPLCVMNRCTKEKVISRWQLNSRPTDTIIICLFNVQYPRRMDLLSWNTHDDQTLRRKQTHFYILFLHGNYHFIAWSHYKCHIHEMLFPNLKKNVASAFCYFMNQNNKTTRVLDRTAKGQICRPLQDQDKNGLGGRYSCACVKGQIYFWWPS